MRYIFSALFGWHAMGYLLGENNDGGGDDGPGCLVMLFYAPLFLIPFGMLYEVWPIKHFVESGFINGVIWIGIFLGFIYLMGMLYGLLLNLGRPIKWIGNVICGAFWIWIVYTLVQSFS